MSENKIRVHRNEDDFYRINISDDGDEIVFDLQDIDLPIRIRSCIDRLTKLDQSMREKIIVINNKYNNQPNSDDRKTAETLEVYRQYFADARSLMDDMVGKKGAMDIIFGPTNYIEMFDDLFEALEPHFKAMNLSVEGLVERLKKKYGKKDENVLK